MTPPHPAAAPAERPGADPATGPAPDPALRLRGVRLGYGRPDTPDTVGPVDLDVPAGRVTALIGANGCGKSTLLRGLTRQLPLRGGSAEVLGRDLGAYSAREYARTVALLPQHPVAPEGMTVAQLVQRGRHPHRGLFGAAGADDDAAVARALRHTDLEELADREVAELSGGQRQRAWLALVLAQRTPVLLLDEPTSYLDLAHQVEVLDLVRGLTRPDGDEEPVTVVAVLHELSLAARVADRLVALRDGRVAAAGTPAEVLTPAVLAEVFDLDADVRPDPLLGHPVVLPRGAADRGASHPSPTTQETR
ncbi:ABC transporter ATP-binding protein [Micrococcus endophyticus]|uniref:Iron complex transport system ATP-binding protein n=1 Tax=Micrococcus endophyticus TaxID=455343 RepID=A0A7W9JKE4_9MICC|nr:ABC transporter ATP-binding protein [Micrococcus endophyticus]MBB5849535.1 iron complex transport system ATP-binding protein [Micrococcus endophyticus]